MSVARGNAYLPWIQPILVAKEGTHVDTILCGALASFGVWLRTPAFAPAAPAAEALTAGWWSEPLYPASNFDQWLAGPFGKTVRRCSTAQMSKIAAWCAENRIAYDSYEIGDSVALALPPMRYEGMPKQVAKAQVAGTDLPRTNLNADATGEAPDEAAAPYLTLRVDEGLTTGKATAQAAHALWMWGLRCSERHRDASAEERAARIDAYVASGPAVTLSLVATEALHDLDGQAHTASVRDAGLTEIAAGTLTAVADWRP